MADDNFYPIDQSTATEADSGWNDAALLSQLAYAPNNVGFVVQGMGFSVDFAASPPLLTVETGWARLAAPQGQTLDHSNADPAGPPPKTVLDQVFPAQIGRRSGIELASNSENYVYLTGGRSAADDVGYITKTAKNPPDGAALLVGTVDTVNDEYDDTINRLPSGEYGDLRVANEPTEPTDVARQADLTAATVGAHDHGGENLGESEPVASATVKRLAAKGTPWFDVTAFGAVGDGQADDSGAIQAATDAASAAGGGVVFYPEPDASYHCNTKIVPKSGAWHVGPRPYGSTITASGFGQQDAVFDNRTGVSNVGWYGLDIDASGAWANHNYHFNQKCIAVTPPPGTVHSEYRNLFVEGCWTHGSNATSIGIDSIINQRYYYNIIEGGGTDGQDQGSNGLGIGVGQVDGPCPTYAVGNWIRDTAEFAIIFEQTGNNVVSEMFFAHQNIIEDARVGIGIELVQGFSAAGNLIRTSPRMDYGVLVDHLDDNVDPAYGSVVGNTVMGEESCNVEAGLIGSGASYVGAWGNVVEPTAGDGFVVDHGSSVCVLDGFGVDTSVSAGETPSNVWAQHGAVTVRNAADGAVWQWDPAVSGGQWVPQGGQRIETGQVAIAPDTAPADDTWASAEQTTASVAFDGQFSSPPAVFVTAGSSLTGRGTLGTANVGTGSFDVIYQHFRTSTTNSAYPVHWLAIE